MSRVTADGRHLTYELKVIQQPERARACGSGAKCMTGMANPVFRDFYTNLSIASADRRPVDPPPVVELKVYEREGDTKSDITLSHNANFFLFTTLESARAMAKGRMPATQQAFPVLTGSPVAGMAYLDRPNPAGYFIFPDLSVRHEGKYRLSFSLFEELKEAKDADVEPPGGSPKSRDKLLSSDPMAPRAHVHFRLEVKSQPFDVFSAKKFPGLAESTPLSRTVAEQGCRVRIRRDVRMRRRDKPSDGYRGDYDEESYAQCERFGTPQQLSDRPRSISNCSIDAHTPYSTGRRPSSQDYFPQQGSYTPTGYQPPPPPPPPVPVQSAGSYGPHLSFGGHVSTPTFPPPQMQPPQSAQNYVQNTGGVQYHPTLHSRQMSAPQNFGYQQPQQQLSTYPNYTSYMQPQSYNTENPDYGPVVTHRRASSSTFNHQAQQVPVPQGMTGYSQNYPNFQQSYYPPPPPAPACSQTTTPTHESSQAVAQLPPLRPDSLGKNVTMEPKYELKSPSSSLQRPIVPSPSYAAGSYDHYGSAMQSSNLVSSTSLNRTPKRDYGAVFDTSHLDQPSHNGMRPSSADHGRDREQIQADTGELHDIYDECDDIRAATLVYKRADGSQQIKRCPPPVDRYEASLNDHQLPH